jgi:hypothetical protein
MGSKFQVLTLCILNYANFDHFLFIILAATIGNQRLWTETFSTNARKSTTLGGAN